MFRSVGCLSNELSLQISIDGQLLLMRETNLRNTDFVNGVVLYSGNDTKIQRSNLEGEKPRIKSSKITKAINKYLIGMMLAQTLFCIIAGVIHIVTHKGLEQAHYLALDSGPVKSGLVVMWTFFILLCQMVPISLVVSSEMVKFVQSTFINWDAQLYDAVINKKAKCNVSTIHEDLGLIDFIFSDKTGTLTQNKMEFRFAQLQKVSASASFIVDFVKLSSLFKKTEAIWKHGNRHCPGRQKAPSRVRSSDIWSNCARSIIKLDNYGLCWCCAGSFFHILLRR